MILRFLLSGALTVAALAEAGWEDVSRADAAMELARARQSALATVSADPHSAEAVAAAGWWLRHLEDQPEPEAILAAVGGVADPEVVFLLARVEAELLHRPPAGSLPEFELVGPFGVFDRLDLERGTVPFGDDLPPPGTRWRGEAQPFRLSLRSADGWAAPPEAMFAGGVHLAGWSISLEAPLQGWLVVEARGSYNLRVDGRVVDGRRECGRLDPATNWYSVDLAPGRHRVELEIASRQGPEVRLSLLAAGGEPARVARLAPGFSGPWAGGSVAPVLPPARAALARRLGESGGDARPLRLAASLARVLGEPAAERRWLERAEAVADDDPWTHLALARFYLAEPTGADADVDFQRCRDHLERCRDIPSSALLRRALNVSQRRFEDAETILAELYERHPDDVRVLRLWVREAVRRGWAREADEGLERLTSLLPGTSSLAPLRLGVLEGLQRWEERNRLLQALADADPLMPRAPELLASAGMFDQALEVLSVRRQMAADPGLDLMVIRLLMQSGAPEGARGQLDTALERWGPLPSLAQLRLILGAWESKEAESAALEAALAGDPSNLQLQMLAWRRGIDPFFAPFRVDALALAAASDPESEGVDSVLILDQAVERVFENGSSVYYYHGLSRALTPEGARQAARLQLMPDAVLLRVRVIKPDGSVVVPADIGAGGGEPILRDVDPGDLVEEEYVAAVGASGSSRRGHLSPYTYRFADPERAFGLSEYILLVPSGIDLEVEGNFSGLEREELISDGLRTLSWRATRVDPVPPEPFSPPMQELLPWVTYGFGLTWNDVGDTVRDAALPVLEGCPELWRWSEPLLAGGPPEEAARRLVDALVDEVEPAASVLDLRTTAGESFTRGRGNRLGIVAAAFSHAGWKVDLVLSRPLAYARSHLEVPSMEAFGIPLLRAESGGETVWVDLEEGRNGVAHIRPMVQGSDALALPLTEPGRPVEYLERLPLFANPDLEERIGLSVVLDRSGGGRLEVEMPLRGGQAERMMERVDTIPESRVDLLYRQVAAGLFPGAEQVRGEMSRQGREVILRFDAELSGACDAEPSGLDCRRLNLVKPLVPELASLPTRSFPLVLQLPVLRRYEVELQVPEGFEISTRERRLETRFGAVTEDLTVEGRRLRSVLRLEMPAQVVAPEEYEEFVRFCHAIDELMARPFRFDRIIGTASP